MAAPPGQMFADLVGSASKTEAILFAEGWSHERQGRAEEAAALYRRLPAGPLRALGLARALALNPGGAAPTERAELAAAPALARGGGVDPADVCFGLGGVLDGLGLWDAAFSFFDAANRAMAGRLDLARAEADDIARHDLMRRVFDRRLLEAEGGRGHPSPAPIFVLGLPRSGSTLIEQILDSHPQVQAMGERDALTQTAQDQFPLRPLADRAPDHFRRLGARYLARMRSLGWDGRRRFVDKFPPNYLAIGLIALMFPRAVILHTVRGAADTCFSNYRHRFFFANELSYDLAVMGRAWRRYRALVDHWREVLPGRVIDVDHEALVADPEPEIRRLVVDVCGLPWNDRCLDFHRSRRDADTLSARQVKRPIFATSIGRWRAYEPHLGPLIEALGPYAS